MLLSQISSVSGRGATVLSDILMKSQFSRLAQFREDGTDYVKHPVTTRSEPSFRAKSGSFTPEDDNPTPSLGELKFLGKEAELDKSYKIDAEKGLLNLDLVKMRLLKRHGFSFGRGIDKLTFSGDGTGSNISGFSVLLDGATNVPGFSSTMTVDAHATSSLDITDSANWDTFMEFIDELLEDVPDSTMIACNGTLKSKINTIGRNTHALGQTQDQFGRPVDTFNGIPVVRLADGAITNTEPDNQATPVNDTTSLYVIRFSEVDGVALASNAGFLFTDFPETQEKVVEKARMELYYDIDIEAPDAIRRLRFIKAA